MLTGTLCKKSLGAAAGGLVHVIWMEKGPDACRRFLNNVQYSVTHWLQEHGFSMGIGDTVADTSTMRSINVIINNVMNWHSHFLSHGLSWMACGLRNIQKAVYALLF